MNHLHQAALLFVANYLCPMFFALVICRRVKDGRSLLWLAPLMFVAILGSVGIFLLGFIFPFWVISLAASVVLLCWLLIIFALVGRLAKIQLSSASVVCSILLLPVLMWLDFRFCVLVQGPFGQGDDLQVGHVTLVERKPDLFSAHPYVGVQGVRVSKRVVYFGFMRWLEFRDEWGCFGYVFDEVRRLQGDLRCEDSPWGEWPRVVSMKRMDY